MKLSTRLHRGIATGLLATTLVLALTPVAEAGHHRRYKGVEYRRDGGPTRVIVRASCGSVSGSTLDVQAHRRRNRSAPAHVRSREGRAAAEDGATA